MGEIVNVGMLNCVYFTLLMMGIVYAIIIAITGGLESIELPDLDIDIPAIDLPGGLEIPEIPVHLDIDAPPSFDHGEISVPALSPITIASFVTSFGGLGIIGSMLFNFGTLLSLFVAVGGALIISAAMFFLYTKFLIGAQVSSEVVSSELRGLRAEVITPIPAGGVGEIAYVSKGARLTTSARAVTGEAIARGSIVVIEDVLGSVALVRD